MRKTWVLAGAALLAAVAATGGGAIVSGAQRATPAAPERAASTARVQRGTLSATVSLNGTLTYQARPDGAPYSVVNQARGTYTSLPEPGDTVGCGDVLYRVDDTPVLLLCGPLPAYRDLRSGDTGSDVRQLNQNLSKLGYDARAGVEIAPDDGAFTVKTERALRMLQQDRSAAVTGRLDLDDAVFQPEAVRVAPVTGELGGPAQPGARVLFGTSGTPEVQVSLEPSQQGQVKEGDRVQVTLPNRQVVPGTVVRIGRVAQIPAPQQNNGRAGAPAIPAHISLDDPGPARGLDKAPVQVAITTRAVENVLSVPVTALLGKSGGGFAVEVVRAGGARELVAVQLGLFDTTGGRVEVEGELGEGDQVVVPSL